MQTPQLDRARPNPGVRGVDAVSNRVGLSRPSQWLCWLHEMLPDANQLLLFQHTAAEDLHLCACSPANATVDALLTEKARSCLQAGQAVYLEAEPDTHLLCLPLSGDQSTEHHVLLVQTSPLSSLQQNTAVQLAMWAYQQLSLKPEATVFDTTPKPGPDAQLAQALMSALYKHDTFTALAYTLVNNLASLCGCVRVSLGAYNGQDLQLVAMSGQSKIDNRRKLARQLCALMLETMASTRAMYPDEHTETSPAAQAYFRSQGEHPLLSFVMPGTQIDRFVLVMERDDGGAFSTAQADAIEQSIHRLASLLAMARARELTGRQKTQRYLRTRFADLPAFNAWSAKRWFACIGCVALLASFVIPVTHRVSAEAYIEASDRQVLVAAQDGFILSSHARAGELVSKGDLLATLDDQSLQLAAEKWLSEKAKNQQEYSQALAIHDRSELSRLRADLQRIDAEIALVEEQLERSEVRAPFDGVLLNGDWTQSLGAPVATGDVLFEIASAEKYRLILQVDEHDVGYVKGEQVAQVRMAALPTSQWQATLGDVLPVAVSETGHAAFRVPAKIAGQASALLPGMEGVAKVNVGERSMFWVYTHRLSDKVKYLAWKIGLL